MAFGQQVGELLTGHRERDREGQVVQKLQRGRHPVLLVRITARHDPQAVRLHGSELVITPRIRYCHGLLPCRRSS
jgi:hypothetical protein